MSVRFDATTDMLTRIASVPSNVTFSVCLWCRLQVDRNNFQAAFSFDDSGGQFAALDTDSDGTTMTLYARGAQGAMGAMTVGTWYYIAMTKTSLTHVGYFAAAGTPTLGVTNVTATGTITAANKIWIGNDVAVERWDGNLQNVKIWDGVVLTQAEIEAERWNHVPQRTANLWAWLPMLDAASPQTDFSGNGRDFTVAGTLTTEDNPPVAWSGFQSQVYLPAAALVSPYPPFPLRPTTLQAM
jgi:hypothetical protein